LGGREPVTEEGAMTSPPPPSSPKRKFRGGKLAKLALGSLVAVLVLATLEGLLSFALVLRDVATKTTSLVDERRPERKEWGFDAELGWAPRPSVACIDSHDPGVRITTNSLGIRSTKELARVAPAGRVRAVLSGDSFTWGSGVTDDATWGAALERVEPRLETANLACGGYGLHQMWLRYRRDGALVDHQLHLVAFITDDLNRMLVDESWGGMRPHVELRGDELAVTNLPLHEISRASRKLSETGAFLANLKLVEVPRRLIFGREERPALFEDGKARLLGLRILADLAALSKERGSRMVVVQLTVESEYGGGSVDVTRSFFRTELARLGIPFVDLVEDFRALPAAEHATLYLREYAAHAGHYDAKGNEFVAHALQPKLRTIPEIAALLDGRP
jgi:hypothetical protein